jgi:WhiB family redox-sensing transcriptional regulator
VTFYLPIIAAAPWMIDAACTLVDPDTMFPDRTAAQIERAKTVCRRCTVRADCLEYATDIGDDIGVYGGLTGDERQALRRKGRRTQATVTVHGATGYHRGCRCDLCRAAHTEQARRGRDKKAAS